MSFHPELLRGILPGETHRRPSTSGTTTDIDRIKHWAKNTKAEPAKRIYNPNNSVPRFRFSDDHNINPTTSTDWEEFEAILNDSQHALNFQLKTDPYHSRRNHFFLPIGEIEYDYNRFYTPTTDLNFSLTTFRGTFRGLATTDWEQIELWLINHAQTPVLKRERNRSISLHLVEEIPHNCSPLSSSEFMNLFDQNYLAVLLCQDGSNLMFSRQRLIWPNIYPTGEQLR